MHFISQKNFLKNYLHYGLNLTLLIRDLGADPLHQNLLLGDELVAGGVDALLLLGGGALVLHLDDGDVPALL